MKGFRAVIDSAGTSSWHSGEAPDPRAIQVAMRHGVDISGLRARVFIQDDFEKFDIIYVADEDVYRDVVALAESDKDRARVEYMLNVTYPSCNKPVPDPYYGGEQGFENVYELLDEACEKISEIIAGMHA